MQGAFETTALNLFNMPSLPDMEGKLMEIEE
jgi:hypothetical protein